VAIPRGRVVRIRDTPVSPEDPEHRELEAADDTDAEAEAHKRREELQL
jgi:hypothetical protein